MSKQPTTIVLQTNATHVINTSIYQYTWVDEQTLFQTVQTTKLQYSSNKQKYFVVILTRYIKNNTRKINHMTSKW